jgi:hypothetical protein
VAAAPESEAPETPSTRRPSRAPVAEAAVAEHESADAELESEREPVASAPTSSARAAAGEDADPNATTLISEPGIPSSQTGLRPSSPPVSVEEALAEHPPVSVGNAFFRGVEGSLAPVTEELDASSVRAPILLTDEQQARRNRLRRIVVGAVAAVALLGVGLVAKATLGRSSAEPAPVAAVAPVEQPAAQPAAEEETEGAKLASAEPAADPASQDQAATTDAPTEPSAEPEAAAAAAGAPDASVPYAKVKERTLELLNKRQFEAAIPWAQRLIALEPTDSFGYRCLGSALQDLQRIEEAHKAYSDCVTHATKGAVRECGALGGQKQR